MSIPRIVIAGTNSGCGKTTVTTGVLAALIKRGYKVQPFKVGPDYIDPMFHTFVTGCDSRNLDSWMLREEIIPYLFKKNAIGKDIAVIEGVMGIFDGYRGYSQDGSTAHVSKLIQSPVVLLVNGEGLSLSAAALVNGFRDFDREVRLKGIIINNIKSEAHYGLLKEIIEEKTGLRVLGYLPKMPDITISSRHLGLLQSSEVANLREKISLLADQVEKTIDLELLVKIAREAEMLQDDFIGFNVARRNVSPKIAVARDKAFSFYYKDNLELLELLGAELVNFSPLEDEKLPGGTDGLYIGGGYPEVWARELQNNVDIKNQIRGQIENGLPAYAECGGLMYLSQSIKTGEGESYEMVGVVPGKSEMTASLQRFGYVEVEVTSDNILAKKGYRIRAHEFHYSNTVVDWNTMSTYKVIKKKRGKEDVTWQCGFKVGNLLAGYPHLHFWSNTGFAERFVNQCIQHKVGK
ncbi:MAG: cobyrinate a,c-diamide synthase [Clostridia bacterium]|nr:cobyrinate a,c-diamide synthase [Clostridia bacterium]